MWAIFYYMDHLLLDDSNVKKIFAPVFLVYILWCKYRLLDLLGYTGFSLLHKRLESP